ncbi:MAG TPA: periplasmic heavy metal sensor [bacterium]|nr:Spy/CpxP family protein refolding chaperone [bacterium]HDQ00289.1 periplasmic heavy metal sensor [bacterium]
MKKLIPVLALAIVLLFGAASLLSAQPMWDKGGKFAKGHPGKFYHQLNLTDEQQSKIADLRLKLEKEILPIRSELQSKHAELALLKTEDNPNIKRINGKIDEISELRSKIQKIRANNQMEIRKLLDADQRKIFDSGMLNNCGKGNYRMGTKDKFRMHRKMMFQE